MARATATEAPRISDADMPLVMDLLQGVDSVELKLTIPTSEHRATITNLPMDPVEAQPRQVFFFDTPDLALDKAGVVVRARRIQGGRADTVIKLRPVDPAALPPALRRSTSFNVELDLIPGGFVPSGSLKGRTTGQAVRDAVRGATPIRKIFSKEQRALFKERAPAGIDLDSLIPLGPTFILKTAFQPKETGRRMVAELWLYQDGSRILELSTKCLPSETFQVAAESRAYLVKNGVVIGGSQQTKTRTALEFFKAQLDAANKPARTTTARKPAARARKATKSSAATRRARLEDERPVRRARSCVRPEWIDARRRHRA